MAESTPAGRYTVAAGKVVVCLEELLAASESSNTVAFHKAYQELRQAVSRLSELTEGRRVLLDARKVQGRTGTVSTCGTEGVLYADIPAILARVLLERVGQDLLATILKSPETVFESVRSLGVTRVNLQSLMSCLEAELRDARATVSGQESEQGEGAGNVGSETPPGDEVEQGEGDGGDTEVSFLPSGDGYYITGLGEGGHFRKLKGFAQIARLIHTPGEPVPMLELVGAGEDESIVADKHSRQPALDDKAKKQLQERLREAEGDLEKAIDANETVEAEHCKQEIEHCERELRASVGIGGKVRDLNSLANKLRPTIYASLARAYKVLREAKPPMNELADHFEAAISAEGTTYVYRPAGSAPNGSLSQE